MRRERARQLRHNQTDAEPKLWHHLRIRQLGGRKFSRQYPSPHIADFSFVERGLIVELDGGKHSEKARYDSLRSEFPATRGFEVIRFWDNDVLARTEAVLESILQSLIDRSSPQPSPRKRAEGA